LIFEGEDWTTEEQQQLIEFVTKYVEAFRKQHDWDVVNYFGFSKARFGMNGSEIEYLYFCQRRNWGYNLMGFSVPDLAQKLQENLAKYA
jgi:hypothetical protein